MARIAVAFCLLLIVVVAAAKKKRSSAAPGRIVGGNDTEISRVPYQVSLLFEKEYECGGSIIRPKFILTAAHCVLKPTSRYSIRAGSKYSEKEGVTRTVKKIRKHPHYNYTTNDNDIAILELHKPLGFNESIKPIRLVEKEPEAGDKVLVSGWGAIEEDGSNASSLKSVAVEVVDRKSCEKIYEGKRTVTKNMFCAGVMSGGKDACKADSGGPAQVGGYLAGIISWGKGCGREGFPGVYTNIVKYKNWIRKAIDSMRKPSNKPVLK